MLNKSSYFLLLLCFLFAFLANLSFGSVTIPIEEVFASLWGNSTNSSWSYIITNYRLPKAITAILVGGALSVSGVLMQTLFRNPLAGPFVLGISSGASLGVALVLLSAGFFSGSFAGLIPSKYSLIIAASCGSFLVLLAVVVVSSKLRDTMAILIIGLMFGSISSAIISVLSYFSPAEKLQQFVFWGFGSLGNLSWKEISLFSLLFCIGILLSIGSIKPLNALLLNENYAASLGVSIKKSRLVIIIATSLLAGTTTAFAGPIAFIGLATPHITRMIFKSANHSVLVPTNILFGASIMLICDTIAQVPNSAFTLPINAITSLIGAPVVIWLLLKKRSLFF